MQTAGGVGRRTLCLGGGGNDLELLDLGVQGAELGHHHHELGAHARHLVLTVAQQRLGQRLLHLVHRERHLWTATQDTTVRCCRAWIMSMRL